MVNFLHSMVTIAVTEAEYALLTATAVLCSGLWIMINTIVTHFMSPYSEHIYRSANAIINVQLKLFKIQFLSFFLYLELFQINSIFSLLWNRQAISACGGLRWELTGVYSGAPVPCLLLLQSGDGTRPTTLRQAPGTADRAENTTTQPPHPSPTAALGHAALRQPLGREIYDIWSLLQYTFHFWPEQYPRSVYFWLPVCKHSLV